MSVVGGKPEDCGICQVNKVLKDRGDNQLFQTLLISDARRRWRLSIEFTNKQLFHDLCSSFGGFMGQEPDQGMCRKESRIDDSLKKFCDRGLP